MSPIRGKKIYVQDMIQKNLCIELLSQRLLSFEGGGGGSNGKYIHILGE
jgi:hypothetical protein